MGRRTSSRLRLRLHLRAPASNDSPQYSSRQQRQAIRTNGWPVLRLDGLVKDGLSDFVMRAACTCSARTSLAVKRRKKGRVLARRLRRRGGRWLPRARRCRPRRRRSCRLPCAASMALMVEAPVVQTSSTMTTRAPSRQKPSMRRPVPWAFSALRTRKPWSSGAPGFDC